MIFQKLRALKDLSLAHAIVIAAVLATACFAVAADKVDPILRALVAIAGAAAGLKGLFMAPPAPPEGRE